MASESIYDHPRYYEILFSWDRSHEADFYRRTFERCGAPLGSRVLEVACGTAVVARLLDASGWSVAGFDARPGMVSFARARGVDAFVADMTTFAAPAPFAAAYNPLSSFRLLHADAAVDAHLARMAAALRPGGIYVIDTHLLANEGDEVITTDESWEMTEDGVTVRGENDGVYVNDHGIERVLAWGDEEHLRGYTADTFAARVRACVGLEIESWHPESSRATGTSEFQIEPSQTAPLGRTMVVLRRTS